MGQGGNKKSFRLKNRHGWKSKPGHALINNYDPVSKGAWRSLALGVEVKDPTAGPVSH